MNNTGLEKKRVVFVEVNEIMDIPLEVSGSRLWQ